MSKFNLFNSKAELMNQTKDEQQETQLLTCYVFNLDGHTKDC